MTHGLTTVFVGENIDNMGCVQDNLLLIGRILGYRHRNRPYLLEEDDLGITILIGLTLLNTFGIPSYCARLSWTILILLCLISPGSI